MVRIANIHSCGRSSTTSSMFIMLMVVLFVICALFGETKTEPVMEQEKDMYQHSRLDNGIPSEPKQNQHTAHDLFSRLQRSGSVRNAFPSSDERKTCVIEVQEIRRIPGHCIRLMGGTKACQSAEYLDPLNDDCQ